tara:strand:- start:1664 stop:1771 length:108 start_codon:yes stop_codon:yes gene_type:complete
MDDEDLGLHDKDDKAKPSPFGASAAAPTPVVHVEE